MADPSPLVDPPTLRASFQLDAREFACVLGVHVATVYRWEKEGGKGGYCSMDPQSRSILTVMSAIDRRPESAEVHRAVKEAVAIGGLFALHVLLTAYFKESPAP